MLDRCTDDAAVVIIDPQVGVDDLRDQVAESGRPNGHDAEDQLRWLLEQWRAATRPVACTLHDSWECATINRVGPDGVDLVRDREALTLVQGQE